MSDAIRAGQAGEGGQRIARAPSIVVVGASTGGPQALVALLTRLAPTLRHGVDVPSGLPVCVTLHMPRDLMPVIATYVAGRCGIATSVVSEPCRLVGGQVYFAPGDRSLGFDRRDEGVAVVPLASPGRRKSAVDAMFAGAAARFGARALGLVLSGMGEDGLAGSRAIVAQGGAVLAQDRASAAVWGMPGAVARAGLASLVLPPAALADEVISRVLLGTPAVPALLDRPARGDQPVAELQR